MIGALPLLIALLTQDAASNQVPPTHTPYRMIEAGEGMPLVVSRLPIVPPFDPETERVAFLVHPFNALEADLPFMYQQEGEVVRKESLDQYVVAYARPGRIAVLVCRRAPEFGNGSGGARASMCELRQ